MDRESFFIAYLLDSQRSVLLAQMAAELHRMSGEEYSMPTSQLDAWLARTFEVFRQSVAENNPRPLTSFIEQTVRQRAAEGYSHHGVQRIADAMRAVLLDMIDKTCSAFPDCGMAYARQVEDLVHLARIAITDAYMAAYEQIKQRADEMSALSDINLAISSTVELDEVLCQIIENALRLLKAEVGSIYVLDKMRGEYIQRGIFKGEYRRETVPPPRPDGHTSLIMRTGQPLIIPDTLQDSSVSESTLKHGIRATIGIPIRVEDENIGVFYVHSLSPRPFTDRDMLLLTILSRQAAVAVKNARLFAEERHRREQLRLINQVGWQISSIMETGELMGRIITLIRDTFNYYYVDLGLIEGDDLVTHTSAGGREGRAVTMRGLRLKVGQQGVTGWVASSGQPAIVPDVAAEPRYYATPELPDSRSMIAVPLKTRDEIIGVLSIEENRLNAFNDDTLALLRVLADQVAIAISNAQLYNAEQHRRRLAEALEQAGRELASSLDLREVPGRILEQLATVIPYECGAVMLRQDSTLQLVAQCGALEGAQMIGSYIPICEGDVFQQVVAACRPVIVDDVTKAYRWPSMKRESVNLSWVGVPLVSKDRVVGILSLTRREVGAFSSDDATWASAFAGQAAIALENARLYDQITRFNDQLEQMVQERTEELNKAYQTLERLDRTKSDFIDVAAHELRTPLAVIMGYSQVLDTHPGMGQDAEIRMLLTGIVSGANRLHEIVNSLLDVTRLNSQTLDMRWERVVLSSLIEHIHASFKAALQERRLTLMTSGMSELPWVQGDPDLLTKVFYHLVINAIKYTPDGGTITVSGKEISGEEPAVEIAVSDTGIGIDLAHHELIFEKFYQTGQVACHSSGKTKFKGGGPGLGLAIARGIVRAHNGLIWVESKGYDEKICPGSCFHVLLPVSSQDRPKIPSP